VDYAQERVETKKRTKKPANIAAASVTDTDILKDSDQQDYREELEEMQQCVRDCQASNADNIKRFRDFQKIVFKTAMTKADSEALEALERPNIEFNMLNPMLDRLCGEFSKQEPSIYASAFEGAPADPRLLEAIQGHITHALYEVSKDNTQYEVYRDQISGGYCSYKIYADYANEMSFEQDIKITKVYDATLVGYDDMSRKRTKYDAEYCYEMFPMTLRNFKKEYPDIDTEGMEFAEIGEEFKFSYKVGKDKIIIVVDFYKKKKVPATILKLSNGQVVQEEDYAELVKNWQSIEQVPVEVNRRKTLLQKVCRYRFGGNKMMEYEKETLSKYLPLVFADGNSVFIYDDDGYGQFTKPYMYHAYGTQRLTNMAGQTIANDIENMTMQKMFISQESIPEQQEYIDSITDYQSADVVVYNAFMDNDPDKPVPPPREIQRVGLPQEVFQTFNTGMQMQQNITGSYDAQLGVQNNDLSGVAIQEGATQSNATAMPTIVNNMMALNQIANIMVDMMPKLYKTPRSIPVRLKDGKQTFIRINDPNDPESVSMDYQSNTINIKVEAGVNFEIEKNRALNQLITLMKTSEQFAQFMNTQGMDILLDNMSFKGIEIVKERAEQWMEQQKQQPQQPNPELITAQAKAQDAQSKAIQAQTEQARVQSQIQQQGYETAIKAKQVENETKDSDTRRIEALTAIGESRSNLALQAAKVSAEEKRTHVELGLAVGSAIRQSKDQEHNHIKDILEMSHGMNKDNASIDQQQQQIDLQSDNSSGI